MSSPKNPRGARTPAAPPLTLDTELTFLKGAGPQAASALRALDLHTVGDLLFHLPLRYEDRRAVTRLIDLREGMEALVRGRVEVAEVRFAPRRMLVVAIDDGGNGLLLRFFHFNETQRAMFVAGRTVQAFGSVRSGRNGLEMVHPEYQVVDLGGDLPIEDRLTPIYPLTAGMTQPRLRRMISQAVDVAARDLSLRAQLPGFSSAPDTLTALEAIHRPGSGADAEALRAMRHPAQQRLIREELLAHQLCMRLLRRETRGRPAPALPGLSEATQQLQAQLPFRFTGAQTRVLAEIGQDMVGGRPMLRLVQGDVGSGKTVVAAAAMLAAANAGHQAALMAPTELLAEQHHASLQRWLNPLGLEVVLLSGKLKKREREARMAQVADGSVRIVVGTHAIFQADVTFAKLALAVVDEQHRFGVQQRLQLRDKGPAGTSPHQLVMSATPIPRTLAQTLYADLDVSVIDELPPGRTPIVTVAISHEKRGEVLQRMGEACREGRQAYWVCTLIEESDEIEAQAAAVTATLLREALPELRIGLVHGRLKPDQKELEMRDFKDGRTHMLVATTVIEVGVDVPNASIMVIDNAERLGLSQLHQLRGRVGRGARASQCVLLYQPPLSQGARARLDVMRTTTDGFRIAQADLELRGPGELLGRRQTGLIGLKLADPVRDADLIPPLQKLADEWLERSPQEAQRLIRRWVGDVERYARV
ncbi:ATP-dependent DNA helicase RecG [Panacagrimonas perspica]|uniref:ATP-dependent DNA helicase RecG n=1 Tax=Panacagrimonas perspica TaxID=381431 RepID=A0A4S3K6X7_9GAMM|nr:ATP-dependent DNA helicase RecG [Panacagrimonas perspica]TDU26563.1 ATP-dependent DNA helicase RecG [Panacagrimonas perspica]THD03930.1 ATP-dependent DNA helicase RecG [Panacagrimonas perspica]